MTRWEEEVELLKEEMRQCIKFFRFFGDAWDKVKVGGERNGQMGRAAFCQKKVNMYRRLTQEFDTYMRFIQ